MPSTVMSVVLDTAAPGMRRRWSVPEGLTITGVQGVKGELTCFFIADPTARRGDWHYYVYRTGQPIIVPGSGTLTFVATASVTVAEVAEKDPDSGRERMKFVDYVWHVFSWAGDPNEKLIIKPKH